MRVPQAYGDPKPGLGVPFPLEEGVCYLVKGKSVDAAYRLVRAHAEEGVPILCVSRIFPDRLRAKYGLAHTTQWWITSSPGEGHFDPTAVGTLSGAIERFIEDHPDGCVVLLDGIEFIAIHIGFTKALLFIEHLNEYVMPRRATMLVPVDPECFEPSEFARLDRFTGSIADADLRDALDTYELSRDTEDG
jgi:two-component system cell cycle response regulator